VTHISDHAVIRWLERVKGIDMDAVRAEMDTPTLAQACEFGAPVVIGKNGERLVIRDGKVVTVVAKGRYQGTRINR
jgi:phosphohistidine swiveling domain-containing protein